MQNNKKKHYKYEMPRNFSVEITRKDGKICVTVNGVISIIGLEPESCIFKVRGGSISISGEELSVNVFENNICDVVGGIKGVNLL
jgi:hypothetical protein